MVEADSQFENPLSSQEKEELLCPGCGVLFRLVGYKFYIMEITTCRFSHSRKEINETLNEEPTEETWLKMDEILEQELHVNEAL